MNDTTTTPQARRAAEAIVYDRTSSFDETIEVNQIAALIDKHTRLPEVLAALEPFAKFACDEPHTDEPECHNCRARRLLAAEAGDNAGRGTRNGIEHE